MCVTRVNRSTSQPKQVICPSYSVSASTPSPLHFPKHQTFLEIFYHSASLYVQSISTSGLRYYCTVLLFHQFPERPFHLLLYPSRICEVVCANTIVQRQQNVSTEVQMTFSKSAYKPHSRIGNSWLWFWLAILASDPGWPRDRCQACWLTGSKCDVHVDLLADMKNELDVSIADLRRGHEVNHGQVQLIIGRQIEGVFVIHRQSICNDTKRNQITSQTILILWWMILRKGQPLSCSTPGDIPKGLGLRPSVG